MLAEFCADISSDKDEGQMARLAIEIVWLLSGETRRKSDCFGRPFLTVSGTLRNHLLGLAAIAGNAGILSLPSGECGRKSGLYSRVFPIGMLEWDQFFQSLPAGWSHLTFFIPSSVELGPKFLCQDTEKVPKFRNIIDWK